MPYYCSKVNDKQKNIITLLLKIIFNKDYDILLLFNVKNKPEKIITPLMKIMLSMINILLIYMTSMCVWLTWNVFDRCFAFLQREEYRRRILRKRTRAIRMGISQLELWKYGWYLKYIARSSHNFFNMGGHRLTGGYMILGKELFWRIKTRGEKVLSGWCDKGKGVSQVKSGGETFWG